MEPRLKYSSKWTPFPQELREQIQQVFLENFKAYTQNGKILVEGRIYLKEVLLRVGYQANGNLKQSNFEVSIEYDRNKDNMLKMIHIAVDGAAAMMEQHFQDEEVVFPRHWQLFEFADRPVYLQFSTVNSQLEAQADALLGIDHKNSLLNNEDENSEFEEELKGKISLLGLTEEDFPSPTTADISLNKRAKKSKKKHQH